MSSAANCDLETWKLVLSIAGYLGAALAFVVGLRQSRRGDYWKRSEFLATEMKLFFDDARVGAALTMIDWGVRRVKQIPSPTDPRGILVTRTLQCEALRPHTMLNSGGASDTVGSDDVVLSSDSGSFTPDQAAIRDAYDRFLDGLDRFGNYLTGDLLSVRDLKPYLDYWVNSIADTHCTPEDSLWSLCVLAYIQFYSFVGVQRLFKEYGHDIGIEGSLMKTFARNASDPVWAKTVLNHLRAAQRTEPRRTVDA
jgi:hypothetical protein